MKLTELNHYRLVGRSGLRVSPLCLGTMTFGLSWGWGSDKEVSREIFDTYLDRGGNFVDTANYYTGGTSEEWIGEFMEGKREEIVLATKYSLTMREGDPNAGGNNRKNLMQSLEASLRRLKTDYIDLYYLHVYDSRTPMDEIMRAMDDAVSSGKVLYVAISDTPAWRVAQANTMADLRGWTPFVGLQIPYSLVERTVERELIPMAQSLGLGLIPWSPLGGGLLTGKYSRKDLELESNRDENRRGINKKLLTEKNFKIIDELAVITEETGYSQAQVAINWVMRRPGVCSPIIGARTMKQLDSNLGSLDFSLSDEQMERLNNLSAVAPGFPNMFLETDIMDARLTSGTVVEKRR